MKIALFVLLFGSLFSALVAADSCFVSYAEYEASVPHFDIDTCPAPRFAKEEGFCRLGLEGDTVFIYHFELGNEGSCLVAIDSYPFAEFVQRFGARYKM